MGTGTRRWTALVGGMAMLAGGSVTVARAEEPAPTTYEGMVLREEYVPTRYGSTINIDVCHPAVGATDTEPAPGPFPTIIQFSYGTSAGQASCSGSNREFVRRGYVVGTLNSPGTGESDNGPYGKTDNAANAQDFLAMHDAVEWLAGQSWSTGNVGGMGASGNGPLVMGTAATRPPSLKAVIPSVTTTNGYNSIWPGGMRALTTPVIACTVVDAQTYGGNGLYTRPRDQADVERSLGIREEQVREQHVPECPLTNHYAEHPNYDEFWEENRAKLENIDIPVWVWGGWDDLLALGSTQMYRNTGVYKPLAGTHNQLQMGFTSHAGPVPGFNSTAEALRFFDRWLKGIDTGIEHPPRRHPRRSRPRPAQELADARFRYFNMNEWTPRVAPDYPIPGTRYTPLYLGAGKPHPLAAGGGSFEPPRDETTATYAYAPDQGGRGSTAGFVRLRNETNPGNRGIAAYNDPSGRGDQRLEAPESRVVFLSEPMAEDATITGPLTATIYASTTAADTDFVVKVLDIVPEDGEVSPNAPQPGMWRRIVAGYLKGTHRSFESDYTSPSPIPSGEVVRYDIQLDPTGWMVEKGHRIGVTVSSADFPWTFPNPNPAIVTVHASPQYPSHVTLPLVPAGASAVDANGDGRRD